MTREEAKRRLLDIEHCTPIHTREDARDFEALEMAIQALSQEPVTTTNNDESISIIYPTIFYDDVVSREAVCEIISDIRDCISVEGYWAIIERLKKLPSVTPKPVECNDVVNREELLKAIDTWDKFGYTETGCFVREPKGDYVPYIHYDDVIKCIKGMPSVTQKSKTGHCKECKYFEYDSVAKVDGIPLIVAHEICNKWGNGCKTSEDGYCYLYEPQERSDKE